MKRSKHSLSHYQLATFNMGYLVPVSVLDVLPGDSIRMSTSTLLRVSPLVAPVMHPVSVRIHHWFVPYRLLWPRESAMVGGFEQFITGGSDGEGDGSVRPSVILTATVGSLGDYMGIPPGTSTSVSALPFRAYNKIWNENYRDQDLQPEVAEDDVNMLPIAWEKDIFTAARPWTQKGPVVTLPIGGVATIIPNPADPTPNFTAPAGAGSGALIADAGQVVNVGGTYVGPLSWDDPALLADLSTATSVDISELRRALAIQRYQEARAQFGSRYTEYLRYLGVRSSDSRLQRPEYLGGGRSTISFSEVLNTGGTDDGADVPVGNMSGHGISAMRTRPWVKFFEEHGVVLTLASVRPRSIYADGIEKMWLKDAKEQFYQKELELIGQDEIQNQEVYQAHTSPNGVFGYQDRYYEYRHQPSRISGEFRTVYDSWHFARMFAGDPALNADFIECDPGVRPFASGINHQLIGMFSHSIQARRMVGNRTIGRVI